MIERLVMFVSTKHNQILCYIEDLEIGYKISVRQIAKELNVSEGTAYRAIKEAENRGIVSTIERVGTVRIESKKKSNFEKLTFTEVLNIVDGQVLGGKGGLHKSLNKFVIGAMELKDMLGYINKGNLLIVGNRIEAHQVALENGAAVLITGGFDTGDSIKKLADELQLPVISSSYDSFTVATLINRAIYDRLIKKEIMHAEDILIPFEDVSFLDPKDTVERWYDLKASSKHSRYPVINIHKKVVGIVTSKDIIGNDRDILIEKVMTKNPITVVGKTSVASAARIMVSEGLELLPVIYENNMIQGIISRQDVLKAMQTIQRQPQVGETIDDTITSNFTEIEVDGKLGFQGFITPQMSNSIGTLSYGVFSTIVTEAALKSLIAQKKNDAVIETLTIYFIRPIQIETKIEVVPNILELGRMFSKIEIEVLQEGEVVGKAIMMVQLIDR